MGLFDYVLRRVLPLAPVMAYFGFGPAGLAAGAATLAARPYLGNYATRLIRRFLRRQLRTAH